MTQQSASGRVSLHARDAPRAEASVPKPHLLLVDDDTSLLQSSATVLHDAGFDVDTCGDPDAVLLRVREWPPDLLLLDLHFDARHAAEGLDCLRRLRGRGYGGAVVIWSGDCSLAMAHAAARAGANGYLLKCDLNLVALLRHLLREGSDYAALPPAAEAYLRTRGLSEADITLLREWCVDCESEKCVASRLGRNYQTVRTQLKRIRERLGAQTLADLARILGVLSCFAQRYQL